MRVLHVMDSLGRGGAEIVVKGLLEHQQDSKASLYVLRSVKNPIPIKHPEVVVNDSKSRFSLMPLFGLRRWLKAHPADVLHCHLFRSQVLGWLLKIFFFPNIKLVFHEHGRIFGSELGSVLEDRLYVTFIRIASARVDRFIAISRATQNRLITRSRVRADKISVLYNFIDPLFHSTGASSDARWKLRDDARNHTASDFRVGFAGRLVDRKGWRTFLDAADHVIRKLPGFKFLIAGDGSDKQLVLETIKKKNLNEHIIYIGQVEDMKSFYNGLDCLVVPSLWEPQGLVEIEAQASGVPVIASNTEALNEIIQAAQNGLLFEPGDARELAEKILLLQSQPGLSDKLIAGGLATSKLYEVSRYAFQLRKIYERLQPR